MSKLYWAANLLTVGTLVLICLICNGPTSCQALNFDDLVSMATKIESSENLADKQTDKDVTQRQSLVHSFVKEPKNDLCSNYLKVSREKMSEFHVKAQMYMEHAQKGNKNWFGGLFGPVGALSWVANYDTYLRTLVDKYQKRPNLLTEQKITCDLSKFLVLVLDRIMLVYETDIKTLVTGKLPLVNRAILDQLNKDNLVSKVNFYEFEKPTPRQQKALLEYLGSVSDPNTIQVQDAMSHYLTPGQFILGRIMDTCMYALQFNEEWIKATTSAKCLGMLSPAFSSTIDTPDKHQHLANFCHEMLNV